MGKKYVEEFVFNNITLEEILHKIKVENDESYYYELINDLDVIRIVNQITNRYSMGDKCHYISRDVVKGIVEEELMLLTWKQFKIWFCAQDNLKNGYLAFIYKYLPLRVQREVEKERPGRLLVIKENSEWTEDEVNDNNQQFIEVLSGSLNDIELISDVIQENEWNSINGYIKQDNEDENFEVIINNLIENQKDVIRKIYKEKYTERELAKEKNISHQSVHRIKSRAIKILRKKLKKF